MVYNLFGKLKESLYSYLSRRKTEETRREDERWERLEYERKNSFPLGIPDPDVLQMLIDLNPGSVGASVIMRIKDRVDAIPEHERIRRNQQRDNRTRKSLDSMAS